MAKNALVERDLEKGARLIHKLQEGHFPIQGAAWHLQPDDDSYALYIVTPFVENPGPKSAYAHLLAVLDYWPPSERVHARRIHLVSPSELEAQEVLAMEEAAGSEAERTIGSKPDGVFVGDGFVYVLEAKATPEAA